MKRHALIIFIVFLSFFAGWEDACADLDQFVGDSAIYSASTDYLRPNVLFIVDNSAGMSQAGSQDPYDPDVVYSGTYTTNQVYERKTATGGTINYVQYIDHVDDVTCSTANNALLVNGYYAGELKKNGACDAPQTGNYFLGNILNYIEESGNVPTWQAETAYALGDKVAPTSPVTDSNGTELHYEYVEAVTADGVTAGTSGSTEPSWPATPGATVTDGGITWKATGSILAMVQDTLKQVVAGARESVKFGLMVFGSNNQGGEIETAVLEVDSETTAANTNHSTLVTAIDGISLLGANTQPVHETLWDAGLYIQGNNHLTGSSGKISSDNVSYDSPIDYTCQKNFVIVLTTGSAADNSHTKGRFGDFDGDGEVGWADDGAKWLYETDMNSDLEGSQRVNTHVIQLLTPKVANLEETTDAAHGRGEYYKVNNANELTKALLDAMANVVHESDTSFVAPVVPTSPENRTYSGERVYMGFFKPISQKPWHGNLKKFAIDSKSRILDRNGVEATLADGTFNSDAVSFWSSTEDAGQVEEGGAGQKLIDRDFVNDPRKIYTYDASAGTNDLTDSAHAFNKTNISPADLGYDTGDATADGDSRDKLVDYIYGYDSYDEDGDADTSEKRYWIFGDILHSRPQIVNYNHYEFNQSNEEAVTGTGAASSCTYNKTIVYVGTNDGMLHAIRDCDGKEVWSFIPDNLLPNLKQFHESTRHNYYVDSSPVVYTYDHDNDGNIGSGPEMDASDTDPDGVTDNGGSDMVLLIFGERRGGGAYYALDVTDPATPEFKWKFDATTDVNGDGSPDYAELGETWSEPQLGTVKTSTGRKVVAFIGGGYDRDEDGRFGANLRFPASHSENEGAGDVTSSGSTGPPSPGGKGRAIYAVKIADLDVNGVPTAASSPGKVWGYTYDSTDSKREWLKYSFPTELTLMDRNYDGLVDRIYAGDTGGRLWRFSLGGTDPDQWEGNIIAFLGSSDNTDSEGQKIFYRPSVTDEGNYVLVATGTGDRAHPLNTGLTDRFFMVKDRGQTTSSQLTIFSTFTEDGSTYSRLEDVTENTLQKDSTTDTEVIEKLTLLSSDENYGWYIDLDREHTLADGTLSHAGEKVLASPLIFNKVAYFTTYTPNPPSAEDDPCAPGNLGHSRLYAVDYKTGEAVLNFASAGTPDNNDDEDPTNKRAVSKDGNVLRREDRSVTLGVGIPSGLVVVMPPSGDAKLLIGCGGGLCSEDPTLGGTIIPIYWMQW